MRLTFKTAPLFNLKNILKLRDEIIEGRFEDKTIIPKRKKFLTEQYIDVYNTASKRGLDISNYPKPENLWKQ